MDGSGTLEASGEIVARAIIGVVFSCYVAYVVWKDVNATAAVVYLLITLLLCVLYYGLPGSHNEN